MKNHGVVLPCLQSLKSMLAVLVCLIAPLGVFAQGTAFTYQGRLDSGGVPATGSYDLSFALFDAANSGAQQGNALTNTATGVTNGLFTVTLDFGDQFPGADRWLEIGVRTNGGGVFSTLSPRQQITATPYAMRAANAATATTASSVAAGNITGTINITQLPTTIITNGASGVNISGTFSGVGTGLTNLPGTIKWQAVTSSTLQAEPNRGYLTLYSNTTIVNLPVAPVVGDIIRVSGGNSSGGWMISQNDGQRILMPGFNVINPTGDLNWFDVASSDDGTKLIVAPEFGRLYISTNSGAHWLPTAIIGSWKSVATSADGVKLVAVLSGGQIYTSSDGGANWVARAVIGSLPSVSSSADGSRLIAGASGGNIYTSTDSGTSWVPRDSNRNWSSVAISGNGIRLVAVVAGGQIYTSADFGSSWVPRDSNRNWSSVASSADGSKLVAAVYDGSIYTSSDSGTNWTARVSVGGISVTSSADGSQLVAVPSAGKIHRSTNSGVTWTTPIPSTLIGPAGFVTGGQFTALELQYVGDGQFFPLSHAGSPIVGN
jgi:hypothetical protein